MSLKLVKPNQEVKMVDVSSRPTIKCDPAKSKVQQNLRDKCDINSIVARALKTGVVPVSNKTPRFEDVSRVGDYQAALQRVSEVEEAFASLPATVRERFANNPEDFLSFIEDDKNYDEAVKLGLIAPKVEDKAGAATAAAPAPEPEPKK